MRLSGNYFERLQINVAPFTLLASLVIFLLEGGVEAAIFTFLVCTAAFWFLDTLFIIIKYNNPKALKSDNSLVWGDRAILPKDIIRITPITDNRYRWSFKMIEFALSDGQIFMIIDKPQNFIDDLRGKPSKTLKLLSKLYPELDAIVTRAKSI